MTVVPSTGVQVDVTAVPAVAGARHPELSAEGLTALGLRNACDRESIHLSGAIQPHGFLLVVDARSFVVTAASTNVPRLVDGQHDPLGLELESVLGAASVAAIRAIQPTGNPHDSLPLRLHLPVAGAPDGQAYDMVAHRRAPVLVLEFEPASGADSAQSARFFQRQRDAVKALLTLDEVDEICRLAVYEVRKLTGYDRVMVYRFEPDGHGHVVAEARRHDLEPFLGLHYPAGDIPRQARVLYLRNWIRVIADTSYTPVPIDALPGGTPVEQIDLSLSVLRSVSPTHLVYLRNMGVGATMTISIIVDNQLWGMIACHHDTPKHVEHLQRLACEALGQLVSVRIRAAAAAMASEELRNRAQLSVQVVTAMAAGEHPSAGVASAPEALLAMTSSDGAVVEVDGVRTVVGVVPAAEALDVLLAHLVDLASAGPGPLALESVPQLPDLPPGADLTAATGSLFLPLPDRVAGFVLWVRGERAQTVRWAGRPELKPDGPEADRAPALTPRASFEEWLEDVRGRSLPWRRAELAAATELAQAMPELLLHRAQNRLVRLALHDPLTGLPNRVLLHDRLDGLLSARPAASAADGQRRIGVLFVDIDGFKAVNDSQGHLVGDELLVLAAKRMAAVLRPEDVLSRMGGDEFVVVVPDTDLDEAVGIAQRVVEAFRPSFVLGGVVRRTLSVSVGATVVPLGTEPAEALRQADSAMYHAKRSGRDQTAVYDPRVGTATSRRKLAGEELSSAIGLGQITVHYQAILDITSAGEPALHGFEALARWSHPTRGLVLPDQFIGLAEATDLIDDLGDAVLRAALLQLQVWPDRQLTMAVNVSVQQLLRPGFAGDVIAQLVHLGIAPGRLCLEITESQMMEQPALTLQVLAELHTANVCIGIDDFGTGFSSMAYVRDVPASKLKVDQLFVSGLPDSRKDCAVVAATVRLAHSLGMRTVAEGVETAGQLAHLRELGSYFAQGFLFGRPLPAEEIDLTRWVSLPAVRTP